MPTPNYLDHIPDSVVDLFAEVHQRIIQDACRRFTALGGITEATAYQTWRAQNIGAYYDTILDEMAKGIGISRDSLADLMNDAAVKTLRRDDAIHKAAGKHPTPLQDSPHLQQILWDGLEQTLGTFKNLAQSAAYYGSEQLGKLLDRAWLEITSGAFSYDAAIKKAITELTQSGVTAVEYQRKRGDKVYTVRNNIDVVVRRATLSGINQSACKMQMARMKEMGTRFVIVTAHAGARDSHAIWQGLVYQLDGSDIFPNFYEATGYGTPAGLGGANCRHGFYPWYPDISADPDAEGYLKKLNEATVTVDGQEVSLYDATQMMRANERMIREWKRTIAGLEEAGLDTSYEKGELEAWQAAQRKLVDQTGLRRDYTRERAGKQYAA